MLGVKSTNLVRKNNLKTQPRYQMIVDGEKNSEKWSKLSYAFIFHYRTAGSTGLKTTATPSSRPRRTR